MGLTKQQALEMLESDDLIGIGMEAHQMRMKKNDPRAYFIVENLRAAAGDGLQPGIHQALDGLANTDFADFGDTQDLRRRKTVQVHLRIASFEGAQQIFVIADLQIGMQPP